MGRQLRRPHVVLVVLALLLGAVLFTPARLIAQASLVRQEIQYERPAAEIFLVWGIDGWNVLPDEATWPPGTVLRDGVMHTPMRPVEGNAVTTFVATVAVPGGSTLDYGFLITRLQDGQTVNVWEADGGEDFHTVVERDGVLRIRPVTSGTLWTRLIAGPANGMIFMLLLAAGLVVGAGRLYGRFRVDAAGRYLVYLERDTVRLVAFALVSRLLLLAIGYLAYAAAAQPNALSVGFVQGYWTELAAAFGRADASWYLDLALNGYEARPFSDAQHANWAFYPLWPLLWRAVGFLVPDMILGGVLLSTLFFVLALVLLYRLIALDFDRPVARLTTVLAVLFPAAYFCSRPGPEALFLLLTVGALFAARQHRWPLAGLLGALATLTRLQGVLLLVPLLYIYDRQRRDSGSHQAGALSLLAIPAALGGFMLYLGGLTGNPLASFHIQRVWDNTAALPLSAVLRYLADPHIVGYYGFDLGVVSFLFVCAALVLTVLIAADRSIPREYLLFTLLHVTVIISRNSLTGSLRYMIPIFPLYLVLALRIRHRPVLSQTIFFVLVALQTFYFIAFVQQFNWAAN